MHNLKFRHAGVWTCLSLTDHVNTDCNQTKIDHMRRILSRDLVILIAGIKVRI